MAEGLNSGGAAKDITKMFATPAAADAGSTLRTAAADAAIKDAESQGPGSILREPLANAESRGLAPVTETPHTGMEPRAPPVETGGATRAELPSKGEAPRTEIATDARPDVDPASQQGAISRTGTGLGNEAIAQADAAAAEQAVRDAELLTSRASGAATRADLNASGASAGSDVLKAAQNAEARALSETMSRIKAAAADPPARDAELVASRATTAAGRTGASSPEAALTGDAAKGAPKLNGSALDFGGERRRGSREGAARDIQGCPRTEACRGSRDETCRYLRCAGGGRGGWGPLSAAARFSADAVSDDLPAGISRVVDKETGDIKFRGPDGKVYDNIPKDTIYVNSKGIAAVGRFPEERGANVLKELSGNAKKLTKKDGPALSSGYSSQFGEVKAPEYRNLEHDVTKFEGISLSADGKSFTITDVKRVVDQVEALFRGVGQPLTQNVRTRIEQYITDNIGRPFEVVNGIPGTHAEVRTLNYFEDIALKEGVSLDLEQLRIAVVRGRTYAIDQGERLVAGEAGNISNAERKLFKYSRYGPALGDPFPACTNCGSIHSKRRMDADRKVRFCYGHCKVILTSTMASLCSIPPPFTGLAFETDEACGLIDVHFLSGTIACKAIAGWKSYSNGKAGGKFKPGSLEEKYGPLRLFTLNSFRTKRRIPMPRSMTAAR